MAEKHVFVPDRFRRINNYTSPRRMVDWQPPARDRSAHGNHLHHRMGQAWRDLDSRTPARLSLGLPHPIGVHITFRLCDGSELQFKKLESLPQSMTTAGIRLHSVRTIELDGRRYFQVIVWIPQTKRGHFLRRINEYLNEGTLNGNPKHNDLMSCIEDIRASVLEDFWPPHETLRMPADQPDWVEAWLAVDRSDEINTAALSAFSDIAERLGIVVRADQWLRFPERSIVLIRADRRQLQALIESCDQVAELRLGRECAGFLVRDWDANAWTLDLASRTIPPPGDCPAVCILDTGVNSRHPLLQHGCAADDCLTVVAAWGTHDHSENGHGTGVAGLAMYGQFEALVAGNAPVHLTHRIESVKLFGPIGHPDTLPKDLWGAYTLRAAAEIDSLRPERMLQRSFCSTITSTDDQDRGRPSSWSGAVDQLASGYFDGNQRLVIQSAGNITDEAELLTYPQSNLKAGIEDPAQAWNALTVGACTERIAFHDPDGHFRDHTLIAEPGDMSPHSKTSWSGWSKAWPLKPEIVCEGGNLLKSPDGRSVEGHWDLDVLTLSHT